MTHLQTAQDKNEFKKFAQKRGFVGYSQREAFI